MTPEELRDRLSQIRANRNNVETEIVNLEARAASAPADQREGIEARRERQNAAIANLDRERGEVQAELEDRQAREGEIRRLADMPANRESGDGAAQMHETPRTAIDGALRAIERHADTMADGAPELVERAVRNDRAGFGARYLEAVADEHYRSAFGLYLAHGQDAKMRMTPQQEAAVLRVHQATEARALAEGTGSAGGFGVPFALDPTILLSSNGVINPIRQLASTITVATSLWKGVSSAGVTAGFAAEATEASDNAPTLAQPEINLEKAQAFIPFSIEVGQDYAGFQDELAKLLIDAKDVLESEKFLSGAGHGSHEPKGLLTGLEAGQEVATSKAKEIKPADIYSLKAALPARFLASASWAGAPAVLDAIYKMIGGGSTEPPIMRTRDGGVFNAKTAEWSSMSTATTTTGEKVLLYGDFDEFRVVDRLGMNIELVPHLFGASQRPTGQRGLYAYWRTGSGVLVPSAFRVLKVA